MSNHEYSILSSHKCKGKPTNLGLKNGCGYLHSSIGSYRYHQKTHIDIIIADITNIDSFVVQKWRTESKYMVCR
jgi:hypothetical protein